MDRNKIKDIVVARLEKISKKKITPESSLEELKIDSLSLAELIYETELEFKIRIEDEALLKIKTVNNVIDTILNAKKN
ncbi:acyl carrier protein [Mycoplasmopsis caviae]|uniref:Acyl carrier protein n=1 Tax=Mycoplasmopsis caviae TaxID=55603 RepID=A0A3P8MEJ4_9BACT|nr:acyl carrier protein [Mycoplasmopsis caviae]UUD35387.1 acyl carrier protein [Mycoplasmopsis caviae]VDR41836.1 acyl carrier protein [Mycoplasmopsis caviae]